VSIPQHTARLDSEDLLDLWEQRWAPRLRGVSLAAEVDLDQTDVDQVARALGGYGNRWLGTHRGDQMFRRWPACVVLTMTSVAARDYQRGAFWPAFIQIIGAFDEQHTHEQWGTGFRMALRRLGLEAFDGDVALRNVGPVLMHAGIPTYCFADLLRLLVARMRLDPDLDGDSFLAWATDQPSRMQTLDKPVRRFLTKGTEFAHEFIDRCLELIGTLGTDGADVGQVLLPTRLTDQAVDLARDGELRITSSSRRSRGVRARRQRPQVRLDPWGGSVDVVLPGTGDPTDSCVTWEVIADGIPTTIRSRSAWAGAAPPDTKFRLNRPTRAVVVRLAGAELQTDLRLINAEAPWLTFSEHGQLLASHAALPPDHIWVLYPDTEHLEADQPLQVVEEGTAPSGWGGWRLELVSLIACAWLQLTGKPQSRRAVRGFTRPRIETGPPIPGTETLEGSRVFAGMPHVWLPGRGDARTDWRITVRAAGTGQVVHQQVVSTTGEATVSDLWNGVARPVVGGFSIGVAGPLGYGVERAVFIAEGLSATYRPSVRPLIREGLAPAVATIGGSLGTTATPAVLSFTPTELTKAIEYRTPAGCSRLLVQPPHLRVSYETADELPRWHPRTLTLTADDVRETPGVLAVQLPPDAGPPRSYLVVDGSEIQELNTSRRDADSVCRLDLTQVCDTLDARPFAEIVVRCDGLAWPVAAIRPRRLADDTHLDGETLVLTNPAPVPRLTATIYATRAPWRPPVALTTIDGQAQLPSALVDAGPLLVALSIRDSEWSTTEDPRWPSGYRTIANDGFLRDGAPDEVALSRYLSDDGPVPTVVTEPVWLWTVVDLCDQLVPAHRVDGVRHACATLLAESDPSDALASLMALGLHPDRTVVALVAAGFAARTVPAVTTKAARRLWSTMPAAALLLGNPLDDADIDDALRLSCGDLAADIWRTGTDPLAGVGLFDQSAVMMSTKNSHEIDQMWSAANIVPQALLDRDSRATAARRLFDAAVVVRNDRLLREFRKTATHLSGITRVVRAASPRHAAQIAARTPAGDCHDWQLLPALSSAYAALARLAARGHPRCRDLEARVRPYFRALAQAAPALVTIDLVAAELLTRADLPNEPGGVPRSAT
jgi:hypothetical protein